MDQFADISREVVNIARLAKLEAKEKKKLIGLIEALRPWVDKEIRLDVRRFGEIFKGVSKAYLDRKCNLVLADWSGKLNSRTLESLDPKVFLAVLRDTAPQMLDIVSARSEQIITSRKPKISARMHEEREGFIFGKRVYSLEILNSGGDSKSIQVYVHSNGTERRYGPFKIPRNVQTKIDLSRQEGIGDHSELGIRLICKGSDERRYGGTIMLPRGKSDWGEILLSPIQPQKRGVARNQNAEVRSEDLAVPIGAQRTPRHS